MYGLLYDVPRRRPCSMDAKELSSLSLSPYAAPLLTFYLKSSAAFHFLDIATFITNANNFLTSLLHKVFKKFSMDAKKEKKEKDVVVFEKDLDMSSASRGVWLVKVPKYISNRWEKCPGNIEAGRLKITKSQGQKPNVTLVLSEAILALREKGEEEIPKEHGLIVSTITAQTLGVFSQYTAPATIDSLIETEKLAMEGKVVQKLECRPTANTSYMKLKRDALIKASTPVRLVKQLDRVVHSYKPVSDHKHNIEFEEKKKSEGKKARDEKDKVLDMIFAAFEKHQYYNIRDLVKITRQPVTYLKDILKDVCNYNLKNPHKNTWELKPEYRHYKVEEQKD